MKARRGYLIGSGVALALAGLGVAGSPDDADRQATGPAADRAREAALASSPGGRVTSVESERDEGGAFEVEITRPNGATVDVDLDRAYRVTAEDADERDDTDEPDDVDEPTKRTTRGSATTRTRTRVAGRQGRAPEVRGPQGAGA